MSGEVDNQAQEGVLETAAENEEVLQEDGQVESAQDDNPELVAALAKVEEYKEAALRSHADAQNVRRRAEQDVQKAHKFGLEKFAKDIITVADNLERALTSADSDNDAMREGVELTLKSLQETLTRFEVIALDPHGEPFNPEFHQAMTMVPNPEMEPNTVMDVIQKGYTLHGRLIRPAMVVVSSAA
ncbi:heat shock protein GrpE [Marinomonas sp. MED121]|uniref:nucleotide exchange factor GrpE n=1 Tax=Marinomonas sp. MED121 TaxID=314277 RepID=UPI00006900B2|nr:nucleotide exchange factor GrpE [Marinomonas sp. MED121]EAQ65605.1 heat shock protein GrpE [Marinomonas sp. MED121]